MREWFAANLAWWRHLGSHLRCKYVAWECSDGWYCGGCGRSWDLYGRPERQPTAAGDERQGGRGDGVGE